MCVRDTFLRQVGLMRRLCQFLHLLYWTAKHFECSCTHCMVNGISALWCMEYGMQYTMHKIKIIGKVTISEQVLRVRMYI